MPYLEAIREPRKIRLLRLALLQIAILTTAPAYAGHARPERPGSQPAQLREHPQMDDA